MPKRRVVSPRVKEPAAKTWSNCMAVGDHVFISGMTAHDLEGNVVGGDDMYSQARQSFDKIQALMEAAGGVMDDIVKMTIFVTDISARKEVWRAREHYFAGDFPSCSLIGISALATPELRVEIEAMAILGASA